MKNNFIIELKFFLVFAFIICIGSNQLNGQTIKAKAVAYIPEIEV